MIRAARAAPPLDPVRADAMCREGNSLAARGRMEEALACFEEAVRADPDSADAHCLRGRALSVLGRHKDAIASFEQTIRLDRRYAFAYTGIGNSLVQRGQPRRALKYLKRAARLDSDDPLVHSAMGDALCKLDRAGDAIKCYDASIDVEPTAAAYGGKGEAYRAMGDHARALKMYGRAVGLGPDSADAHHGRALCLAELGQPAEAIAACNRALKEDGNHEEARATRDRLKAARRGA